MQYCAIKRHIWLLKFGCNGFNVAMPTHKEKPIGGNHLASSQPHSFPTTGFREKKGRKPRKFQHSQVKKQLKTHGFPANLAINQCHSSPFSRLQPLQSLQSAWFRLFTSSPKSSWMQTTWVYCGISCWLLVYIILHWHTLGNIYLHIHMRWWDDYDDDDGGGDGDDDMHM